MIVLDTHVGIWWSDEISRLTVSQISAIAQERRIQGSIGISAVTCWEIAMLVERQRVTLQLDALSCLRRLLNYPDVELLPITPEIAVRA